MKIDRKNILLVIILLIMSIGCMSVGLKQSYTDNTNETINISLSRLSPPCDDGFTQLNSACYYQSDLDILQQFIDNSQDGENPPPYDLSPIELGEQVWEMVD